MSTDEQIAFLDEYTSYEDYLSTNEKVLKIPESQVDNFKNFLHENGYAVPDMFLNEQELVTYMQLENIFNEKKAEVLRMKLNTIEKELKEHGFRMDLVHFMEKMRQYQKVGKIVIPKDKQDAQRMIQNANSYKFIDLA